MVYKQNSVLEIHIWSSHKWIMLIVDIHVNIWYKEEVYFNRVTVIDFL